MNNTKRISEKLWLYVMGFFIIMLFILFLFSSPAPDAEGLVATLFVALIYLVFISGFITLWLMAVHQMWYSDSTVLKVLAVVVGGLPAVLVVIFIQFVHENAILERKVI